MVSVGWSMCIVCPGGAWGSPSACHVCLVLLRLRADCEFSDELFFSQDVKIV